MYRFKKKLLVFITFLYFILFCYEFIKYMFCDRNIFGSIYLIINLFILFLLVPTMYNYKKHYSRNRISKFIIMSILGLFSSYILYHVVFNNIMYVDSSYVYNNSIWFIKDILMPIIYVIFILYVLIDSGVIKSNRK